MNNISPSSGIVGAVVPFPMFRIQPIGSNEPEYCGALRAMAVHDAAFDAAMMHLCARLMVATARLAYERMPRIIGLKRGRAKGFPLYSDEFEAIAQLEQLFGVGHPDAERELARLDALQCEPYADEVAWGLFGVLRWLVTPANIVRFGLPADQGMYL